MSLAGTVSTSDRLREEERECIETRNAAAETSAWWVDGCRCTT